MWWPCAESFGTRHGSLTLGQLHFLGHGSASDHASMLLPQMYLFNLNHKLTLTRHASLCLLNSFRRHVNHGQFLKHAGMPVCTCRLSTFLSLRHRRRSC